MNKRVVRWILATILYAGLLIFFVCFFREYSFQTITQTFTIGEKEVNNPDRGFYLQVKAEDKDKIEKKINITRLFLVTLDLYDYRDKAISQEKLQALEEILLEIKKHNAKCIFRAAYGFDEEEVNDADSLERIQEHIGQIAPVINKFSEQVSCVQAGFFGPWGEWHSSIYLKDKTIDECNRCWLLQELVNRLNPEILIAVRRPRFIRDAIDAGLPPERFAFHNDGLMASESDMGTYDEENWSRNDEMLWTQDVLLSGYNGGEMPCVSEFTKVDNIVKEFPKLKITYLNLMYNEDVYEDWNKQEIQGENALDYISDHLGYRFFVSEIKYPEELKEGMFHRYITVILNNAGFAPIHSNYVLEWVVHTVDGKQYFQAADGTLANIGHNQSLTIKLPVRSFSELDVEKIGLRICRSDDKQKENCVELVNDSFEFLNGVNYFYFHTK